MNEHCDEIYDLIYGDKDTFLLSAQLLNRTFGLVPHRPFSFEWDMVQRDPSGEPFLHHRTATKWLLNQPNRPLAAPALMPSCEAALADLRQRWSGSVFHAPERSARARAEEQRLVDLRSMRFESTAATARELELLPGGRVGAGRQLEQHWAVIDGTGPLLLQFYQNGEPIVTLEQHDDGCWHGMSTEPGYEILLRERAAAATSGSDGNDRLPRSAAEVVAALLQPAWFAAGYDAECAAGIGSALGLVNDAYDDVPELIASYAERQSMSLRWRSFLDQLASKLATRREQRLASVRRGPSTRPKMLDPAHYARPA